ncbi:MAG TPA: DUF2789 domain-containing protein [Aeromonadales bacterium]|nr:DUF2789 domain-containing protein [Aeromonadales bacterium]
MKAEYHSLNDLFLQLGLGNTDKDIDNFISSHSPLPESVALADAPFWTPAQAEFIREAIEEDSDWSEVVDELNAALR